VPGKYVVSGQKDETDYGKLNTYKVVQKGEGIAVLAMGTLFGLGQEVCEKIAQKTGKKPTLINPVYLSGVDSKLLDNLLKNHTQVITLEDGTIDGGFGEKIATYYGNTAMRVRVYAYQKAFYDCVPPEELLQQNGMTVEHILADLGFGN
jgi:1-deoxy-D-xylulose-5-phosphate synthase